MTLRGKMALTGVGIRLGVGAMLVAQGLAAQSAAAIVGGIAWMLLCGPLLRQLILPWLYPETRCPGCRRTIPLVGRWKCGSHYTDHRERHVLAFFCNQGHRLESFDCPRCGATILVQGGDRQMVKHGTAVRLGTSGSLSGGEGLLIGYERGKREVRLPEHRLAWHAAITGGTGRGKSTLLANMARQLAEQGRGFTILDPGGDLARAVLAHIPPEREADVLYLDVSDRQHPFPLNVLAAQSELERATLTEELLGVFHKLHGESWGPMLAHQLRMALRSVMLAGGSLRDVHGLFVDPAMRNRITGQIQDPDLRAYWREEFPNIPAIRRSAVTNKLAPVVFHPLLGPIIGARQCILNGDRAIADRQIVLANLASGSPADDVTTLLGTFLVHKIIAAAFRQGNRPAAARRRHVLIVDEFQRFMHRSAGFDQILAEARKYKLSLVVANQFVEQLSNEVRAALFGNVGCLAAFRVGHRDARVLAPEFTGADPLDLLELGMGECLLRVGEDWTQVRTLPPSPAPEDDPSEQIVDAMRHLFRREDDQQSQRQAVPVARAETPRQAEEDDGLVQ